MSEQTQEVVKKETAISTNDRGLQLRSLEDMWRFAQYVVNSGFAPKGDTAEAIVVKFQMGAELGVTPMQAIQNIAVINGRPSVWGDIVPGLVEASGKQEYGYAERIGQRNPDGTYPDTYGYRYVTKRRGRAEYSYTFTVADAKKAKLWGKEGPWTFYPDRMLLNRPRTFCLRDVYPDVIRGLLTVDESRDLPMQDGEYEIVEPPIIDLSPQSSLSEAEPKKRGRKPKAVGETPVEPIPQEPGQTQPGEPETSDETQPDPVTLNLFVE